MFTTLLTSLQSEVMPVYKELLQIAVRGSRKRWVGGVLTRHAASTGQGRSPVRSTLRNNVTICTAVVLMRAALLVWFLQVRSP